MRIAVASLLTLVALLAASPAHACSCVSSDLPLVHRIRRAAAIVVMRGAEPGSGYETRLIVEETIAGQGSPGSFDGARVGSCSCGPAAEVGVRYVMLVDLVTLPCQPWPSMPCPAPAQVAVLDPGFVTALTDDAKESLVAIWRLAQDHPNDWSSALRAVAAGKLVAPPLAVEWVRQALATPSGMSSASELVELYKSTADAKVQEQALRLCADRSYPEARAIELDALRPGTTPELAKIAADYFFNAQDTDAVPTLAALYLASTEPIRKSIVFALAELARARHEALLLSALAVAPARDAESMLAYYFRVHPSSRAIELARAKVADYGRGGGLAKQLAALGDRSALEWAEEHLDDPHAENEAIELLAYSPLPEADTLREQVRKMGGPRAAQLRRQCTEARLQEDDAEKRRAEHTEEPRERARP